MGKGELEGRVAVVTGANTGIGKVTALELARRGARVILAGRSREKNEAAAAEIKALCGHDQVELLQLDLASFAAVRRAAEELLARDLPLHLLINNAGLAGPRGSTADGFELAFGTNHLGHFLLTHLLLDRLRATGSAEVPARIVTVASIAHRRATGIDFDAVRRPTASISGLPEYQVSKLANILFSAELARRLAGAPVHTYSLHPGAVASDVWRRIPWPVRPLMKLFMLTNEEGARTTLHCATSAEAARETGLYYDEEQVREPTALARDRRLGLELWERSEAWCGLQPNEKLPAAPAETDKKSASGPN